MKAKNYVASVSVGLSFLLAPLSFSQSKSSSKESIPEEQLAEPTVISSEMAGNYSRFGLQTGLSIDAIDIDNSSSSLGGMTLDLNGFYNFAVDGRFSLPLGLGLGSTAWRGETSGGGLTYTLSMLTLNLSGGAYYSLSSSVQVGLLVDYRRLLNGKVEVEVRGLTLSENLKQAAYLLYGPAMIIGFSETNRLELDLRLGSGNFEGMGNDKVDYKITTFRVSYNHLF